MPSYSDDDSVKKFSYNILILNHHILFYFGKIPRTILCLTIALKFDLQNVYIINIRVLSLYKSLWENGTNPEPHYYASFTFLARFTQTIRFVRFGTFLYETICFLHSTERFSIRYFFNTIRNFLYSIRYASSTIRYELYFLNTFYMIR